MSRNNGPGCGNDGAHRHRGQRSHSWPAERCRCPRSRAVPARASRPSSARSKRAMYPAKKKPITAAARADQMKLASQHDWAAGQQDIPDEQSAQACRDRQRQHADDVELRARAAVAPARPPTTAQRVPESIGQSGQPGRPAGHTPHRSRPPSGRRKAGPASAVFSPRFTGDEPVQTTGRAHRVDNAGHAHWRVLCRYRSGRDWLTRISDQLW